MTNLQEKSIYLSPFKIDATQPFAGDCFGRAAYADRLTNLINRLPDGGVIAIDAPWGEGKSWFGENWRNKLAMNGYRTAYINAFERDYVEDPFIMLVAEILKAVDPGSTAGRKLKTSAIQLTKALAPTVGKVSINLVGKLLGTTDIVGEYEEQISKIADGVADAAKQHISKRLEDYEKDRKSVKSFGEKLVQCAEAQDKPIVIFIYELDRCRPDFAVKTIEKIKHFFETKNVVFVLLVNKTQLHAAIRGLYGDINAEDYLGKFLHLTVSLPKSLGSQQIHHDNDNVKYCRNVLQKFNFTNDKDGNLALWADTLGLLATNLEMSLRDIERSVSLYALFDATNKTSVYTAWLIALKIKKPEIFKGIKNGSATFHNQAALLLAKTSINSDVMRELDLLHRVHVTPDDGQLRVDFKKHLNWMDWETNYRPASEALPFQAKILDCSH